jgi:aminopeptidase N
MLRGLLGDEVFFRGLREFYESARFTKTGTEELRTAFERVSGRSLERFFEGWIHGADIPRVAYTVHPEEGAVVLRFQQAGEPHEIPAPVRITLRDGRRIETVVSVDERSVERRIPVPGAVRRVEVDPDEIVLAEFKK